MKLESNNKPEECLYEIKVWIEADEVNNEFDIAYRDVSKHVKIPGFRKGKVSRSLMEMHFSKRVEKEVTEKLIQKSFATALEKYAFTPVSTPVVEDLNYKKGENLSFKIKVEYKPEIEISNYNNLSVKKKINKVNDTQVEERLIDLQKRCATLEVIQGREARKEDLAIVDYQILVEEKLIEKNEQYLLELSNEYILKDLRDGIIGMNKGDEREIEVNLPDNFNQKKYASKKAKVIIKLFEIKERKLPNLDDDFAKDISSYNNLEELKNKIREELVKHEEEKNQINLRNTITELITSQNHINLPKSMIDTECFYLKKRFEDDLNYRKLNFQKYLENENLSEEKFNENLKEKAIKSLKKWFILDTIAEKENIKVSEEEIIKEISSSPYAKHIDQDVMIKNMKEKNKWESLREEIRLNKTLDYIIEKADVEEVVLQEKK
ncbi:MAG: trigger factor [bacterium]|nr:trigger factor [bacterium]